MHKLTRSPLFAPVSLLLMALANSWPLWGSHLWGDIVYQLSYLHCFSDAFWQGIIYPRWCVAANGGVGAPIFLFYFPLPFWLSSLLQPLATFSSDAQMPYKLSAFAATLVTACTAWWWLKREVGPRYALLGTLVYLYAPYRMEVMVFRCGLAELWCMAFAPLLFSQTRYALRDKDIFAAAGLAIATMACLLSHVPTAIVLLMLALVYALLYTRAAARPMLWWALGIGWGAAMAAFYIIPAIVYEPFVKVHELMHTIWSNDFMRTTQLLEMGQWRLIVPFVFTIILIAVAAWTVERTIRRTGDVQLRNEASCWSVVWLLSFYLLFSISRPFWDLLESFSIVAYPWRVQAVIALCLAWWATHAIRARTSDEPVKKVAADAVLLVLLLQMFAWWMTAQYDVSEQANVEKYTALRPVPIEYTTQWMTPPVPQAKRTRLDEVLSSITQMQSVADDPRVMLIEGEGGAAIDEWDARALVLKTSSETPLRLSVRQRYFPSWSATLENEKNIPIAPDAKGNMALAIPEGEHSVTLRQSPWHVQGIAHANLLPLAIPLSAVAWAAWLAAAAFFVGRRLKR